MAGKDLKLGEAIGFGWKTATGNLWFFIGVMAITLAISGLQNVLTGGEPNLITALLGLVFAVVNMIVTMGTMKIALKFCDGQKGEYSDLYNMYPMFWGYLGAAILYAIMVVAGTVLLIIPGIIVAIQFGFFGYLIIDKQMGVMDSLKMSSKVTNGAKWKLFGLAILSILINIAGAVCLLVGLLVTIPTTMLAWAYAYRKLSAQA